MRWGLGNMLDDKQETSREQAGNKRWITGSNEIRWGQWKMQEKIILLMYEFHQKG